MSDPPRLIAGLRRVTAVAFAEIDPSGFLDDANAGFLRLLPEAVGARASPTSRDISFRPRSPGWWNCPGRGASRPTTAS